MKGQSVFKNPSRPDHTPCASTDTSPPQCTYRFVSVVDNDASGIFYIRGVDPFQCVEPTGPADVVKPPLKKPAHEPAVIDLLPGRSEFQPLELEESQELSSLLRTGCQKKRRTQRQGAGVTRGT